jgi:uncharacterized membrane protein YkoI
MKLLTLLVTGAFLVGGLGAHATFYEQQVIENTPINQLAATNIALDISNGGLVTKKQIIEEKGNRNYEISLLHQEKEFQVVIDASTGEVLTYTEKTKK